ncbi:hypothetical protein [Nonomuraea sp. NPDC050691]|uniref:hypothetical protein n=1 Tax=Nonomuraea sp. NPDC050691 TaxID=3155661 RepID=UPI0033D8CA48
MADKPARGANAITGLAGLKRLRPEEGAFRDAGAKSTKAGGRTVLIRQADGALGSGRLVGWVEPGGAVGGTRTHHLGDRDSWGHVVEISA